MAKKKIDENEKMEFMQYVASVMAVEIAKTVHNELAMANKKYGKFGISDIILVISDAVAQTIDSIGDVFGVDRETLADALCMGVKQIVELRKEKEDKENESK